ncbi:transglutaminase-like cysteine peptidase [Candidatus Sulfurimonas baltica]|uniref:Transglutaminase-like cysteine peptidase n=1 Tax=Candidatus Sulfurimonas baltica TaxID=2740404 RepID=A0A7S7LVF4_9BACT|nr:transglutaminase-like cysteine peptidase [Candidatus Sulfurimonas baltica]QOY52163.1 transglutaminase-like cysteine peptidase [Candidatus Sulfurimonas baltica]
MFKLRVLILLSLLLVNTTFSSEDYVEKPLLDEIAQKYKVFAKKRFFLLQETLNSVKDKSDLEKLEAVNKFFNDVRYSSDMKIYNMRDYWATPWEFLGKDMGDCEDYVISKYFALKYLGIDYKKLFFTYVRSTKFKEPHMVLTYFETPRSEPLILDNNNHKIFSASQRKDLTPIYNFNGDVLNQIGKDTKKSHKKWDQLKLNMKRKKI